MGDLRKTILSKFGLSVFWSNIWYTSNNNSSVEISRTKLYEEIFNYIFFWGFSFSPFMMLKHTRFYLELERFKLFNNDSYIRSTNKFTRFSKGNLLSKVSILNYYNYITLIFYIYIPTRKKKNSKKKRIYKQKLFTNSLLSNFQ